MLRVQTNGSFDRLDAPSVVEGILDCSLQRTTKAYRAGEIQAPEIALEKLLDGEHFRLLSARMLEEVQSCFGGDEEGVGLVALEKRITALAGWQFGPMGGQVTLRAKWLSAWLAERLGYKLDAQSRYEQFLEKRLEIEEPILGLLARNNLAVLQLQRGDMSSLDDLVLAALGNRLPAASFSLYNVVQISRKNRIFHSLVEPVLLNVITALPNQQGEQWLHPIPDLPAVDQILGEEESDEPKPPPKRVLKLEQLIRYLYSEVQYIDRWSETGKGIQLWPKPDRGAVASSVSSFANAGTREQHLPYAGAASVLYACDFPDGVPFKTPASDLIAMVSDAISIARRQVEETKFAEAKSTIQQAENLIENSPHKGQLALLSAKLEKIKQDLKSRRRQKLESELRVEVANLQGKIASICACQVVERVRNERQMLWPHIRRVEQLQARVWRKGKVDLVAPMIMQLDSHIEDLENQRRESSIEALMDRLKPLIPDELSVPVEEEAFGVLKLCRAADPDNDIEDWRKIETSLNQHNARHHFQEAFNRARDSEDFADLSDVENHLRLAIAWDRRTAERSEPDFSRDPDADATGNIAIRASHLLALIHVAPFEVEGENLDQLRENLLKASEKLVEKKEVLGGGDVVPPQVRAELLYEAAGDLQHAIAIFLRQHGDEDLAARLFSEMNDLFEPVLSGGTAGEVDTVRDMLRDWQSVWPDYFLPDHPFHHLLENSEFAYSLKLAEAELYHAETKRRAGYDEEVVQRHNDDAQKHVAAALQRGFWRRDNPELMTRLYTTAVKYYALATALAGQPRVEKYDRLNWLVQRFESTYGADPRGVTTDWLDRTLASYTRGAGSTFEDPEAPEQPAEDIGAGSLEDAIQQMQAKAGAGFEPASATAAAGGSAFESVTGDNGHDDLTDDGGTPEDSDARDQPS